MWKYYDTEKFSFHLQLFIYDYSRFTKDAFLEDLYQIDVSYLENSDLDLLQDLNSLENKHAPSRKRSRKEMKLKDKPWINNRILKMMGIRDRILQKLKKRQAPDNLQLYKKFRNRVSKEPKESKARYYHNYFLANSQNMKKIWSGIKSIISHKSFTSSSINKIKGNDRNVASDPSDMSNILNNFCINVASSIAKTISITPKSPLDYLSNRTSNSLFLTPVTPFEVKDIIDTLNPSKSVGPNSLPIKLLKIVGCSISPLLALLINQSFQSGIYPDKFKIGKVISLFKKKL